MLKNGKYSHWGNKKYSSIERRQKYLLVKQKKGKKCIECNIKISPQAIRCWTCQNKITAKRREGKKLSKNWCENISKGQQGEKAPNWQGGKTRLNKLIRECAKFCKWRLSVFKRDVWTCKNCGFKNRKGLKFKEIHPHHIKAMKNLLKENNIYTIQDAENCKELWNIDM